MRLHTRIHRLVLLAAGVALAAFSASAQAATGKVGSPDVKEGVGKLEARLGYIEDDDASSQDERFRTRVQYDHGLTDFYAFRLILAMDRRKSDNMEFESVGVDNRFYIYESPKRFFRFGVRAGYTFKDGDKKPDNLSFGFFERFSFADGKVDTRFNQLFKHETGPSSVSGLELESRTQVTYAISPDHRFGIESFNNFGNLKEDKDFDDQSHTLGPVLTGKLGGGFDYEMAWRMGVSEAAPDHTIKFTIGKSFDFNPSSK